MGLGRLLTRAIEYQVTNTETGAQEIFTVNGAPPLAPDWATDDYRGAMGIPGAWRASTLISDLVGAFPWHLYRERDGVASRLPTPPLLEQPSPPENRMTTFSSLALDLIWHGNGMGIVAARDTGGWPSAIFPVPAEMCQIRRVTPGAYSSLPIGAIEYKIGGLQLSSFDVIHIKGPTAPGGLRGMGVLESHLNTLQLAHEQNRQARGLAKNGVPTGLLKSDNPDLKQPEADALKAKWMESQRDRTIAVLNATTDFKPLSWNPKDSQLIEARQYTLVDLALIFGLPARYLLAKSGDSMTYSNIQAERLDLLQTSSLVGHLSRFEATLSQHRPRGQIVRANYDAWLRGDTKTRYEAHKLAIEAGWKLPSEVRRDEDLEPVEGIDERRLPPTPDTTTEEGDGDE